MSYINETDFVIENKKLVYPEIVTDGLQLYYDAKGKRDTDYHRDTMLDMSGSKNHGKLYNFAYEKHSGYKDGLVFDYIDDKLVRPTLDLKPDDFTFMLNGNIISFSPDGTVKRVQDGEVIESKGFNLITNGDFRDGTKGWTAFSSKISFTNNGSLKVENNGGASYAQVWRYVDLAPMSKYYFRAKIEDGNKNTNATPLDWFRGGVKSSEGIYELVKENTSEEIIRPQLKFSDTSTLGDYYYISDIHLINLTKTFGAGNEPTKEQMGEIINRFGFVPNAKDLIDRVEYKGNDLGDMENIIDGLYKTDILSGEEIYTDKADDDAVVHVEVDGKSYQNELGHRLDFPDFTGEYVVRSSSGAFVFKTLLGASGYYEVDIRATNDESVGSEVFWQWKGTAQSESISLTRNWQRLRSKYFDGESPIGLRSTSSGTALEVSNQLVLDYNIPPSPEYPIEIHSLNDFDVVSSVGGRNLVLNSSTLEASGLGATSGTRAEYQTINTGESYMDLEDGEIITISFDIEMKIATKNPSLLVYNTNRPGPVGIPNVSVGYQLQGDVGETINKRISFTTNATLRNSPKYSYNTLEFYSNYGSDNFYRISKLKVERGNKATPWSPAPEDTLESDNHLLIDKINLLLDKPLRSVGDVKDRLFRDSDGVWKIERNVGETQLGSTDIASISVGSSNNVVTTIKIDNMKYYTSSYGVPFRSTHHGEMKGNPGSTWGNVENRGTATINTTGSMWLSVDKENIDTLEKAKIWFGSESSKGTPVIVSYQLAVPTIETLSQSLQDNLNNLRSFEDSNYVYTVLPNEDNYLTENLKPTLHAKFLYNNWYKEDRVINNLMIYNRALTNEEMLQNYKTIKRRWGM